MTRRLELKHAVAWICRTLVYVCGLLLVGSPAGHAAEIAERRAVVWTTAEGLPQNSVNDLLQTPDGALWIATFGGLLRFDGRRFESLALWNETQTPAIRITGLSADDGNGFWFVTQFGELGHVVGRRIVEHVDSPSSASDAVGMGFHAGVILVHFTNGELWRRAEGAWSQVLPPAGGGGYRRNLVATPDGFLTARGGNELVRVDRDGRVESIAHTDSPIAALAIEGDTTWIGLGDAVARYRMGRWEPVEIELPSRAAITSLVPDGTGGLWLGTSREILHAAPAAPGRPWTVRKATSSLAEPFHVYSLLLDREGNLWVGSKGHGLARLTAARITIVGKPSDQGVSAIVADGSEGAFVARGCAGLQHVDLREPAAAQGLVSGEPRLGENACVTALLYDSRGDLWVGADNRLLRLRSGSWSSPVAGLSSKKPILSLVEAPGGDVWLAQDRLCLRIDREARACMTLELERTPICIEPEGDDGLWVGCAGWLLHARAGTVESYGPDTGIPACDLRDLCRDPEGGLWIATYGGGLLYFDGKRAHRVTTEEGLPDDSLSHVEADDQRRLWLLANRGLVVAERARLLDVALGRARRVEPVLLGPESGMPEGNHGSPSGLRDAAGRLWFGTIAGGVVVDPATFPFNRTKPAARIDGLLVDDVPVQAEGAIRIGPLPDRVVFEYTAFALTAPERVRFRYQLEGHDEAWVEAGEERRAAYTRLAPGDYTFRVLARNEDGVWSDQPTTLRVVVLPAWWQTGLFRAASALALLGLLLAAHRWRIRVVERRAKALLEAIEGRARAEENASRLRDELSHVARVAAAGELATSLAHEVNQPLATIVTTTGAARRLLARETLDRETLDGLLGDIAAEGQRTADIVRRLRTFLRKRAAERVPLDLDEVVRDTIPLVGRELRDHSVTLELELAAGAHRPLADRVQMQQVLVNLLFNACEALEGWQGERRIVVRTAVRDGRVSLEVSDTGPGIAREVSGRLFEPYVTTKETGMGLGLAICRSIVESHGGRMEVADGASGSTTMRVEFPHTE